MHIGTLFTNVGHNVLREKNKVKSTNIHMMTADKEQEEREFCENT